MVTISGNSIHYQSAAEILNKAKICCDLGTRISSCYYRRLLMMDWKRGWSTLSALWSGSWIFR